MSFLHTGYSETVAARLTQKGRNAISKGNFNINYFAIGDSEYNYSGITSQKVLAPFDKDVHVKYPFVYTTTGSTIFGVPSQNSTSTTLTNVMSASTGWTMDIVWDYKPIGLSGSDKSLTEYTSNVYTGTKDFLGYTNTSGQTTNTGTTIVDSMNNLVTISPEEQKAIAIIHYSQSGTTGNTDNFFKYDDYIATGLTFSVTLPSISYHRSASTFTMDGTSKQIVSAINPRSVINYIDLLDSSTNRVGKIFYNHKLIVFDDEEIVAALDSKSHRTYTLPAPQVKSIVTNDPITALTTGTTMWVTYMLSTGSTGSLPCNYHMKVTGGTTPHSVTMKFNSGEFSSLHGNNKYYILYTLTNNSNPPLSGAQWKIIDYTTAAGGSSLTNLQNGTTFTINNSDYTGATNFSLSSFTDTSNTGGYFGDEKTFPGAVQVTRATDIQEMTFNCNLPSDTFNISQNPTWTSGNPYITEVALLDNNKNALVMAKLSAPIQRMGSQIIQVKLDF